jgi:hypothetical protein
VHLRRANEGEVEGVEKQNDIFTAVVAQADLFKVAIDDGSRLEVWCISADENAHGDPS